MTKRGHGLDRRTFLSATAAAAAMTAFMPRAFAENKRVKKAIKFSMFTGPGTVDEKFGIIKKLGFDGVELDSPSNLNQIEVLEARDKHELPIHGVVDSVHWRERLSDPDPKRRAKGREALEHAIRECRRYGGSTVLLVPGVVDRDTHYDEVWERSTKEIQAVLPLAKEKGVSIAIENVWNHFLLSPMEAARYVDQFESNVGWYLDIGNIVNYGWPQQWVKILGKRILKLDIKDYSRKKRNDEGLWKGFQCEIGEGHGDWAAVNEALVKLDWKGWGTAEVRGGGEERLREIAGQMDKVLG